MNVGRNSCPQDPPHSSLPPLSRTILCAGFWFAPPILLLFGAALDLSSKAVKLQLAGAWGCIFILAIVTGGRLRPILLYCLPLSFLYWDVGADLQYVSLSLATAICLGFALAHRLSLRLDPFGALCLSFATLSALLSKHPGEALLMSAQLVAYVLFAVCLGQDLRQAGAAEAMAGLLRRFLLPLLLASGLSLIQFLTGFSSDLMNDTLGNRIDAFSLPGRIQGIFTEPQSAGLIFALFACLYFPYVFTRRLSRSSLPGWVGFLTCLIGLILANSRAALVGLAAGLASTVLLSSFTIRKKTFAIVVIVLLCVSVTALSDIDAMIGERFDSWVLQKDLSYRFNLWDTATAIIWAHPIAGVGYGGRNLLDSIPYYAQVGLERYTSTDSTNARFAHLESGWLVMAYSWGMPAFLLLCFLVWRCLRGSFRLARERDPALRTIGSGCFAAFFPILTGFLTAPLQLYSRPAMCAAIVVGLVSSLRPGRDHE